MTLRVLSLAFALMGTCGYAHSKPATPLACSGKMTAAIRHITEDYTLAITVDLRAKTVTVDSFGTVPIVGDTDGDTVVFMVDQEIYLPSINRDAEPDNRRSERTYNHSDGRTVLVLRDLQACAETVLTGFRVPFRNGSSRQPCGWWPKRIRAMPLTAVAVFRILNLCTRSLQYQRWDCIHRSCGSQLGSDENYVRVNGKTQILNQSQFCTRLTGKVECKITKPARPDYFRRMRPQSPYLRWSNGGYFA